MARDDMHTGMREHHNPMRRHVQTRLTRWWELVHDARIIQLDFDSLLRRSIVPRPRASSDTIHLHAFGAGEKNLG